MDEAVVGSTALAINDWRVTHPKVTAAVVVAVNIPVNRALRSDRQEDPVAAVVVGRS